MPVNSDPCAVFSPLSSQKLCGKACGGLLLWGILWAAFRDGTKGVKGLGALFLWALEVGGALCEVLDRMVLAGLEGVGACCPIF